MDFRHIAGGVVTGVMMAVTTGCSTLLRVDAKDFPPVAPASRIDAGVFPKVNVEAFSSGLGAPTSDKNGPQMGSSLWYGTGWSMIKLDSVSKDVLAVLQQHALFTRGIDAQQRDPDLEMALRLRLGCAATGGDKVLTFLLIVGTLDVYPFLGGPFPTKAAAELQCELKPTAGDEPPKVFQSKVQINAWAPIYTIGPREGRIARDCLTRSLQDILRQIAGDRDGVMKLADSSRRARLSVAGGGFRPQIKKEDLKLVTGYGATAAVLSFDAKGGVSADEVSLLSDRFTIELDKWGVYKLVNRSKMNEILKLQNFSRQNNCNATECAIEAGQMLGTQYMIYGSLGKVGKLYTLNTYLINVEKGDTVGSATTDVTGGIEDMLTQGMGQNVQSLLGAATKSSP